MHYCLICPFGEFYSPVSGGAIATIIMELARELLTRGHDVSVLTMPCADPVYSIGNVIIMDAHPQARIGPFERIHFKVRWLLGHWDIPRFGIYQSAVMRALKRLSCVPDVLMVFNDLVLPKSLCSLLPNSRVLVNLQNEQRTRQREVKRALSGVSAIVTCSDYIRDWTLDTHALFPERLFTLTSGVALDRFFPRPEYLTRREPVRILFIGRIDRNKGPDLVADAVKRLRNEGLPAHLTVAGGIWFYGHGEEMKDPFFRLLSDKLRDCHAVYRGHVPRVDVPALVRAHDIVCVLSRSNEPFGLVVLEAMASGCAVLASNRGGLPQACGSAAALVDPEDAEGVDSVLRTWILSPELLTERKRMSLRRAATASWPRVVSRLEAILEETSETNPPG